MCFTEMYTMNAAPSSIRIYQRMEDEDGEGGN
jgi:hypothetical protein